MQLSVNCFSERSNKPQHWCEVADENGSYSGPEEKGNESILWQGPRCDTTFTVIQNCNLIVHRENTLVRLVNKAE